ncbi:hypothetical protein QQY66_16945 [Streptomyces sp. DG2A-72]|uniref:hypothetical protein n=1 Tax=Streptomyces sp. DG2A-72 TaxID=3051386 RepID=UPI00265C83CD|nr:hypothetical protein [Streptomyces sp. DG2A-72]MDO0933292.1 hypothetical protein [Streptomyces sp. DG2A-72]
MKQKYTAAWVGFTAAALVATAGCGAEATKETAEQAAKAVGNGDKIMAVLSRAADRTEELGSAEVKMTTSIDGGAPIAMDGTYSWGDGYAFDVEMDTKAVQMQTLTDAPKVRCLFVDGDYYYDVDPQPSGPLAGKEWMKIDGSAVFGEDADQALSGSSGGSPSASMKSLKYAEDVEDLGTETVNGQRTTHYRAVLDKNKMGKLKELYGDDESLYNSMLGADGSLTMDIWVGDKDLPVRLTQKTGAMKVTMDFEKFGATADVKAPPAAQTGDLTETLKAANGQ